MYCIMRLLRVAIQVEAHRAEQQNSVIPQSGAIELLLPKFRKFWTIVWDHQKSIFHHNVHNHVYVDIDGTEAGSLRSAVMDVLLAIGDFFLDSDRYACTVVERMALH